MFWTHIAFGFLLGLLGILYFTPHNQVLFIILAILGSMMPDIDHPKSKLGRNFKIIGFLFEHRGFFHSLIMAVGITAVISLVFEGIYTYAFIIGFCSHLLIDSITKEGIMPLHPFLRFRLRGPIKTGHFAEWVIFAFLLAFSFYSILKI